MNVLLKLLNWGLVIYMVYLLIKWHRTMNKANLALDELRELVGREGSPSDGYDEQGVVCDGRQS